MQLANVEVISPLGELTGKVNIVVNGVSVGLRSTPVSKSRVPYNMLFSQDWLKTVNAKVDFA